MKVLGYRRSTNDTPIEGELLRKEGRDYLLKKSDGTVIKVRKIEEINEPTLIPAPQEEAPAVTPNEPAITENNIFKKGMLIHINMGGYSGRKQLDNDQLQGLPQEIVRGVHDLFGKEFKDMLREIDRHGAESRHDVTNYAIPFPLAGVYFIASEKIEEIIQKIEKRKEERAELVRQATDNYESAIKDFQEKYPEFYARAKHKYLTKEQFAARFYMKYQFIKIQAPSENDSFVSPEMYQREMAKFRETINEMKQEVLATIYDEMISATERLKKQCEDGKPNQRTLNNLNLFLDRVDDVYASFIDREDMKSAIKKVRAQILGVQAEQLRGSEELKKEFGNSIKKICQEMKALPNMPFKRALDF